MMEWRMESGQGRARRTLTAAALALGFLIVSAAPSSLVTRSSAAERSLTARSTNDTTCPRDKLSDLRFASLAFIAVLGREGAAHDTMYLASRLQYPTSMTYVDIANVLTRSGEARGNEVEALYQQLLHRPAGPSARQAWARWVAGGTPTDLAVALLVSQEYWQRSGSTNGGWVDAVYRDVLGRVADPGGRAMWLAQLDSGRPHWAIARDIYNARRCSRAL